MNKVRGRHFQIEFKLEKSTYYIKDLGIGYGTFIRLDYTLVIITLIKALRDNFLINIGETFMVVNIIEKIDDMSHVSQPQNVSSILSSKLMHLKLKVFGVANNGETL